MKRAADAPADKGKRPRRSLEFLGTCVSTVHLLSDSAAWRAAKAAAASGDVHVTCIKDCTTSSTLCIQGSVMAPTNKSEVAAAAHTHPFPGRAQVQLLVDTRSGELLDADTSCCPGGYHAARGSFCPCVGALLLAAGQLQSLEHGERQELALTPWSGTDAQTARDHVSHAPGKLQQLVQPGLLQQAPAQLLQEVEEVEVLPGAHTQAKLKPNHHAEYPHSTASPDVIASLITYNPDVGRNGIPGSLLSDVACDLPQQKPVQDSSNSQGCLAAVRLALDAAARQDPVQATAAAANVAAAAPAACTQAAPVKSAAAQRPCSSGRAGLSAMDQPQLLAALGGSHLTSYMGKVVPGWEQRPKVINWAFGLLLSAAAHALPTSSAAAGSSGAAVAGVACDGKPLVALTGLMRVLWHCTYVEGLPVQLRGVLLVAMALRNLLLVVALPVWARKAVAAQLRAWQEGISEAHACNPVLHTGDAKLVHLLRVLSEAEQLCKHGWDHPSFSACLQAVGRDPANAAVDSTVAQQQQQQPVDGSQQGISEPQGLLLLRLAYLELIGDQGAYLNLAMAGKQWNHAVSAMLRSGDRSQLRLAAELLPRHITSLSQRLDYMQQLLGLKELPVVERCELAARLLLSLRGDLVPRTQRPALGNGWGWWQVQVWEVPAGAQGSGSPQSLQGQLGTFYREFFKLAGQAQFDLAREAVAQQAMVSGAGAGGGTPSAAAAGASSTSQPPAAGPPADFHTTSVSVSTREAGLHWNSLPEGLKDNIALLLQQQQLDVQHLPYYVRAALRAHWGEQLPTIWEALREVIRRSVPSLAKPGSASAADPVPTSPASPLELDTAMLHYGETSHRFQTTSSASIQLDGMGFVQGVTGVRRIDKVEPFPLPNLLPLCSLAPAALHTVVEGAMAPLFVAAFRPSTNSCVTGAPELSSSRPGDLGDTLLQVAGHPGVEYGGAAVRLQMAVEMVAYGAALTPLDHARDPAATGKVLFQPLLYGLLAMGQQDLAWTVALAAYRVCPGRFTATYLLLLAIQRGYEAQAAAVDWILGGDWPAAAGGAGEDAGSPVDPTGGSPQQTNTSAKEGSSLDTQQLLGADAAEAMRLADTASSRAKHLQSYQDARARQRAALQRAAAGSAAPPVAAALAAHPDMASEVLEDIRHFVEEAQEYRSTYGFDALVQSLAGATGLSEGTLVFHLRAIRDALDADEELIHQEEATDEYDEYESDEDEVEQEEFVDDRIHDAVAVITRLAREPRQQPAAAAAVLARSALAGAGGAAQERPSAVPASAATLVLQQELLGATGAVWQERAGLLRSTHLQPVIQYAAACGLHPDLVTRLALVELGVGPPGEQPLTWDAWVTQSRRVRGVEFYNGALIGTPQGPTATTAPLAAPPGSSIRVVTDRHPLPPEDTSVAVFAAWLLRWMEARSGAVGTRQSHSIAAAEDGVSWQVPLLRQLWLLLQGRCYTPWMLWVAVALDRAGEQQLACEAAAQGMLPSSCSYWGIRSAKKVHASCFEALLPHLTHSGDPAILQQAAATQLLMAQAPVPVELLLAEGVMKRLLELATQLAALYMPAEDDMCLQVPASCMDLSTGHMSLDPGYKVPPVTTLYACIQFMELLQFCVFKPLGRHVPKLRLARQPGQQRPLCATPSPEEEAVVAALEGAVAELHWSAGLCIARLARAAGAIRSWPGLVQVLRAPLAAAAEAFNLAAAQEGHPACTTLDAYKREYALHLPPLVTPRMVEAGGWVNGVLAWITMELGLAILDNSTPATQPPPESVEELSSCLLGFCSPHVLPYATAALQVLQGRSTADITRALVPNGVLPLVGRPENLQACSAAGVTRSPYWAWGQPCYIQALHNLLQQGQLLASLPPDTVQNMAVTYWVKSSSLETMVWVGQLLTWLQQQTSAGAAAGNAGPVPQLIGHPGDVLSIQVHPWLQPYLDLAPATGPQAALQRFLQLQTAAIHRDLQGSFSALFGELREALAPNFVISPAEFHNLDQKMLGLEGIFALLEQQPYAGSPAMSWLQQQPAFHSMMLLLCGLPSPSVMDAHVAALTSPLLRLCVVQLKLWKLCKDIRGGLPLLQDRITKGPPKPWEQQVTALHMCPLPQPSYWSSQGSWAHLPDHVLQAGLLAARAAIPGPILLPRPEMVNTVLGWFQAQEVALAWAVVKYAELRGPGNVLLAELRALVQDPAQLGQLPVFMAHLGAAVKQQRSRYPVYALFRQVQVPRDLHDYVWRRHRVPTVEQLQKYLSGKYNRLELQQVMVQAIPWLDWQQHTKNAEAHVLAEWL